MVLQNIVQTVQKEINCKWDDNFGIIFLQIVDYKKRQMKFVSK